MFFAFAWYGIRVLTDDAPLVLGSGSPRRRDMLTDLGIPFVVRTASIDETPRQRESADDYIQRVTLGKLRSVRETLSAEGLRYSALVAADTAVIVDKRILGKPRDDDHALSMLRSLRDRTHQVKSSYAIFVGDGSRTVQRLVSTDVMMRSVSDEELRSYVATGEGRDKAGSYAIQGRAAFLIERINGSHSNVIGLPVGELLEDLKALGLDLPLFGKGS